MSNAKVTLSGKPAAEGSENWGAPQPVNPATGMHGDYWVLSDEERAKGFVRPVRRSYVHVGARPKNPVRPLTEEEKKTFEADKYGYVMYEPYGEDAILPPGTSPSVTGRLWTKDAMESGCGVVTSMNEKIAETYARDPKFYGSTFCCGCGKHLPVAEFVWHGTNEVVGS